MRILLVEDNELNSELVRVQLSGSGHELELAADGEDGLARFKSGIYDLVLMDIEMPVMDGRDSCRAMRTWEAEDGRRPTRIIALTGHTEDAEILAIMKAGFDQRVSKSLTRRQLLEIIESGAAPLAATPVAPTEEPRTGHAAIETETLDQLMELGDDAGPGFLEELISVYVSDSSQRLESMRLAFATGDLKSVRGGAHSLKSSSANVGANQLAAYFLELEKTAETGESARVSRLLELARTELARACEELNEYVATARTRAS